MDKIPPQFFKNIALAKQFCAEYNLSLNLETDITPLLQEKQIGNLIAPNRMVFQPMEGCDADQKGNPGEKTFRRYEKFGAANAGIVWFEATAVVPEGRANPRQLMLLEENKNDIAKLLQTFDNVKAKGSSPSLRILQLTHSGRYSKPDVKNPQRLYHFSDLDEAYGLKPTDGKIVSDEYLESLIDRYISTARLAKELGFDGVDVKACHRYLLSESLSAYTRENSKYGGNSYENRTKYYLMLVKKLIDSLQDSTFIVTTRVNIYDGIPYPYGWGVGQDSSILEPNLAEPIQLFNNLHTLGVKLVNVSMGNPYFNPHITRPYNTGVEGKKAPELPILGINRFLNSIRTLKSQTPADLSIISSGFSWLKQLGPYAAAHEITHQHTDFAGWGRMTFAYPSFPTDLQQTSELSAKKICLACSKCTELMRWGQITGCVVRDPYYRELYKRVKTERKN